MPANESGMCCCVLDLNCFAIFSKIMMNASFPIANCSSVLVPISSSGYSAVKDSL